MIKFITVDELLPIRKEVLRPGGNFTMDDCKFATDDVPGTFHLGYYQGEELACIASFSPQSHSGFTGAGYQLRGMATIEKYRGKGFGNQLLNFGLVYLRGQKANYVWCNARKKASKFYLSMGFEIISSEFEVPVIGPHFVMYVKIQ